MDKNIHFQHTKDDAELQYIFYVNLSIFNLYCINSSLRILTSTRFPISSVSWITQAKIRTKRILTDAIGDVANGDRRIAFVGIWKNPRGRHQTISFRLENKWIYAVCHITIIFAYFRVWANLPSRTLSQRLDCLFSFSDRRTFYAQCLVFVDTFMSEQFHILITVLCQFVLQFDQTLPKSPWHCRSIARSVSS